MVCGRGTQSILRARGRWLAWSAGPSTSPLGGALLRSTIPRAFIAVASISAAMYFSNSPAGTLPLCDDFVSKPVTLRGTLSSVIDNAPPVDHPADDPDSIVLDVWQRIFVLTLKSPICRNSDADGRPVRVPEATTIEVAPRDDLTSRNFASQVGKVVTVRGSLSKNAWWRYRASMLLAGSEIGEAPPNNRWRGP